MTKPGERHSILRSMTLTALGVVFGDIGTSPLYALREAFAGPEAVAATPDNVLGILSLILWSLILVISVKYLLFVMKADNRGEGGVLALMAIAAPPRLGQRKRRFRLLIYLGLFGSALLFGDGIITPAISVLSAVEGLEVATPIFSQFVVPITIAIIAGLFLAQKRGTAQIGAVFGPVILLWFVTIGSLGIFGIWQNPTVLKALNPLNSILFFQQNGFESYVVLGAVFLSVTGGEALYADMGHFGRGPIQRGWFFVALPALVLNYFGQGAVIINDPAALKSPFYLLAPEWMLYPLVILATMATVIASQALISGVFSLTRQSIQLGYFPRVKIVHTSRDEIGQIYIPQINGAMFVMTCYLVLAFGSSGALAAAYGIAVSTTMVITTILACSVAYTRWQWGPLRVGAVLVGFLAIDGLFLSANLTKIKDGGWVPLSIGAVVFTIMTTWKQGRRMLAERMRAHSIPLEQFIEQTIQFPPARVSGTSVFMSADPEGTPPALFHNMRHNKILHQRNVLLTIQSKGAPYVEKTERVEIQTLWEDFYRVIATYGFMETPDIKEVGVRSFSESRTT